MQFDQAAVDQLREPILKVWQYIASDVYDICDDNLCAVEMCIDANRLSTCVDEPEAEAFVMLLIKEHGYPKVLKFLSKNFRFI